MRTAAATSRFWLIIFALHGGPVAAQDDWQLRGRVVDETGQAVADATVDHYWRSNGKQVRADGSPLDLTKEEEVRLMWSNIGQMEPLLGTTTAADGTFVLNVSRRRHAVLAMDRDRKRGGLVRVPAGQEDAVVEIRLTPLTKVHGKLEGAEWTNVYVMIPEDASRPTDNFRVTQCASFDGGFQFSLPPGKYILHAYGNSAENEPELAVSPDPLLEILGDKPEIDLGTLRLVPQVPSFREQQIALATAEAHWGDYRQHYGQPPPKWHAIDARGVKKNAQLSDFRGKWVLIDFWGLPCTHCLMDDLPRLTKFYEDHAAQRDQFEIIAFCTDCDNDLKSIADLDKALAPIIKQVWKGKKLPFPVLLDPSFTTMERYGFRAYGTMLLIDPNGNLVEGDDTTLAERLKK